LRLRASMSLAVGRWPRGEQSTANCQRSTANGQQPTMRSAAIVGSGISGLAAAHGLLRAGFRVDLYSDRTPEQWLRESRPTGTAARFDLALSYERELGLNFWDDVAPRGEGVFLTFCPTLHNPLLNLIGRLEQPFQAVDVRMQSARWLTDFAAQ